MALPRALRVPRVRSTTTYRALALGRHVDDHDVHVSILSLITTAVAGDATCAEAAASARLGNAALRALPSASHGARGRHNNSTPLDGWADDQRLQLQLAALRHAIRQTK